ncbi:hypothetical protein AWZ03_011276 [Drosophila navojoa]|uniref:MARVEL domain-containing protein n=1 Tax=Drosophila navojoa TaxID=7232 RepID=A0A484B0B2_DRONA|nr:uncharacterized protein LOC108655961 [Drosophila navojoa]TDG42299.1 hypothetical protein AWZ03_011276 [Drosophila navojoa]
MSVNHDYDRKYLRSIRGISKIVCLLCAFIGFLCIVCSSVRLSNYRGCFYIIVVLLGFAVTLTLLLCRYLRLGQSWRWNSASWSLGVHASLAITHFLASNFVLGLSVNAYTAAAFFGLTIFSINGLEAYSCYKRTCQRDVATQTV